MLFSTGASRAGAGRRRNYRFRLRTESLKRRISLNLSNLPTRMRKSRSTSLIPPVMPISSVKSAPPSASSRERSSSSAPHPAVRWHRAGLDYAEDAKLPRLVFINKMDRENADFNRTLESIKAKFGTRCVPAVLPIGAHTTFKGVIDLMSMKAYTAGGKEMPVPPRCRRPAKAAREKLNRGRGRD